MNRVSKTDAAAAAKSCQSCPTVRPHRQQPIRLLSLGFSRQEHWSGLPYPSMHESEAAQSCPILSDSMNCSLPGSSVHGISQARVLEWAAIAFSSKTYGTITNCLTCISLESQKKGRRRRGKRRGERSRKSGGSDRCWT